MMKISRRGFLTGAASLLASTAVARVLPEPDPLKAYCEGDVRLMLRYEVLGSPGTGRVRGIPAEQWLRPPGDYETQIVSVTEHSDLFSIDFEVIERRIITQAMSYSPKLIMIDPLSDLVGKTFTGRISCENPHTSNAPKRGIPYDRTWYDERDEHSLREVPDTGSIRDHDARPFASAQIPHLGKLSRRDG